MGCVQNFVFIILSTAVHPVWTIHFITEKNAFKLGFIYTGVPFFISRYGSSEI